MPAGPPGSVYAVTAELSPRAPQSRHLLPDRTVQGTQRTGTDPRGCCHGCGRLARMLLGSSATSRTPVAVGGRCGNPFARGRFGVGLLRCFRWGVSIRPLGEPVGDGRDGYGHHGAGDTADQRPSSVREASESSSATARIWWETTEDNSSAPTTALTRHPASSVLPCPGWFGDMATGPRVHGSFATTTVDPAVPAPVGSPSDVKGPRRCVRRGPLPTSVWGEGQERDASWAFSSTVTATGEPVAGPQWRRSGSSTPLWSAPPSAAAGGMACGAGRPLGPLSPET